MCSQDEKVLLNVHTTRFFFLKRFQNGCFIIFNFSLKGFIKKKQSIKNLVISNLIYAQKILKVVIEITLYIFNTI